MEIHAIVLAGGSGSRFGGRKLLAPFGEGILLDGALASALGSSTKTVVLVTGAEAGDIAAAARRYAGGHARGSNLRIAFAPDHLEGMAASIRAGVAALPRSALAAIIFLGDMPSVPARVIDEMADVVSQPGTLAVSPVYCGKRGHPVLFSAEVFPKLLGLRGDAGARAILDDLGNRLLQVPAHDPGVLFDVDTPSDLLTQPRDRI